MRSVLLALTLPQNSGDVRFLDLGLPKETSELRTHFVKLRIELFELRRITFVFLHFFGLLH